MPQRHPPTNTEQQVPSLAKYREKTPVRTSLGNPIGANWRPSVASKAFSQKFPPLCPSLKAFKPSPALEPRLRNNLVRSMVHSSNVRGLKPISAEFTVSTCLVADLWHISWSPRDHWSSSNAPGKGIQHARWVSSWTTRGNGQRKTLCHYGNYHGHKLGAFSIFRDQPTSTIPLYSTIPWWNPHDLLHPGPPSCPKGLEVQQLHGPTGGAQEPERSHVLHGRLGGRRRLSNEQTMTMTIVITKSWSNTW